jgi:hypothetical protein
VTLARTVPKKTILSAGVGLKFEPLIVTEVPIYPELGEKLSITGAWAAASNAHSHMETRGSRMRVRAVFI